MVDLARHSPRPNAESDPTTDISEAPRNLKDHLLLMAVHVELLSYQEY